MFEEVSLRSLNELNKECLRQVHSTLAGTEVETKAATCGFFLPECGVTADDHQQAELRKTDRQTHTHTHTPRYQAAVIAIGLPFLIDKGRGRPSTRSTEVILIVSLRSHGHPLFTGQ